MSAAQKTLVERLRDPTMMKRWWDQYGWEAADEIERLQSFCSAVLAGTTKEGLYNGVSPDDLYHEIVCREGCAPPTFEAADKIERLRAALVELEEQLASAVGGPYVERLREIIGLALTGRPLSERHHDADRASISAMAPAAVVPHGDAFPPEGVEAAAGASIEGPFLVADNGSQGEHRYRTLVQGISRWTLDPQEALWFARQRDAQLYAAEDEDAWCILPVSRGIAGEPEPQSHDAPPGGSPQGSRTGSALAVTRARQIDGDAADPPVNTITELCDRLDRIDRIAHDTMLKATERLRQIMECSGGFAKIPGGPKP